MRIIFIGTVELSKFALQQVLDSGGEVVGVITKESSKFNADFADLTSICESNNIDYCYTTNVNASSTLGWVKERSPDIIFCFGWSSLIKKELLDIPPMGVIGYHPAALPSNRGRHPLIWALVLGLEQTASTFFVMDEGADSGDILSQEKIEITREDSARSLYDKVVATVLNQINTFLPKLKAKTYTLEKQNHEKANYWRKRGKADGKIDFRMPSEGIRNLVRALSKPYPGAHIELEDKDVSIWKVNVVKLTDAANIEPGNVISVDEPGNTCVVKTVDGAVEIVEHEFEKLPLPGTYL